MRMTEREAKERLAGFLLRNPKNPWTAADLAFPYNRETVDFVVKTWIEGQDPEFYAIKDALLAEHGEEYFLPSKAELARSTWELAQQPLYMVEAGDKVKAMSLFADLIGAKEKKVEDSGARVAQVLVIAMPGSGVDQWKEKAAAVSRKMLTING